MTGARGWQGTWDRSRCLGLGDGMLLTMMKQQFLRVYCDLQPGPALLRETRCSQLTSSSLHPPYYKSESQRSLHGHTIPYLSSLSVQMQSKQVSSNMQRPSRAQDAEPPALVLLGEIMGTLGGGVSLKEVNRGL